MAYVVPEHVLRERERRKAWIAEAEKELTLTAEFRARMESGGFVPSEPEAVK